MNGNPLKDAFKKKRGRPPGPPWRRAKRRLLSLFRALFLLREALRELGGDLLGGLWRNLCRRRDDGDKGNLGAIQGHNAFRQNRILYMQRFANLQQGDVEVDRVRYMRGEAFDAYRTRLVLDYAAKGEPCRLAREMDWYLNG